MAARQPQRRFVADKSGMVPLDVALIPDAVYVMQRPPPPPAFEITEREGLISFIDDCVLGDLRSLASGAMMLHGKPVKSDPSKRYGGGNFLLAAGCCMALEYLAWIFAGDENATRGVEQFAGRFLFPQNDKYRTYWPVLWISLRNGIIHGAFPQQMSVEDQAATRIICPVAIQPTAPHLATGQFNGMPALFVNSHQFLLELEISVRRPFFAWLRTEASPESLHRGAARLHSVSASHVEAVRAINEVAASPPRPSHRSG